MAEEIIQALQQISFGFLLGILFIISMIELMNVDFVKKGQYKLIKVKSNVKPKL